MLPLKQVGFTVALRRGAAEATEGTQAGQICPRVGKKR